MLPPTLYLLPMTTTRRLGWFWGNGGWMRVVSDEHPMTYAKFARNDYGRWVVVELYVVSDADAPIRRPDMRDLPLADLEAFANGVEASRYMEIRSVIPGPDLRRAASHFATTFGSQAKHWIADSWRAQYPQSGIKQAPMGKEPKSNERRRGKIPRLETPPEGLTDDFLRQVAEAYEIAVNRSEHPAPAIATVAGVSVSAVRKWVYTARKRGLMGPGQQGRVG